MPGGLLSLVCYGNENVILNGNPQLTWFYKSFMKYTHFAQEPVQIPLLGPDMLQMDAPIIVKAKIPRQGDLLSDLVLRVSVPDVFSKAFINQDLSGKEYLDGRYDFQWVRQVGVRMIDNINITIGGTLIQSFNSDWIATRALLDLNNTQYRKWRYMVGDTADMFDPANGIYYAQPNPYIAQAPGPGGDYPNVVAWRGQPQQNNAPTIRGRILRIPIGFWLSDFIGNSLPLVGLQYHDVEVMITFRPIRDLYTITDPTGNRVRPGYKRLPYVPTDQYPTIWNPALYGPLPDTLANLYVADTDPRIYMRNFLTDISGGVPVKDGWPLNATLEATYTFVREAEQAEFSKNTLRYTVRQVQNFPFYGISTRQTYRLDVHNISTRIVWFFRRSDAQAYRNQWTNLTNWMYPTANQRPICQPFMDVPTAAWTGGTLTGGIYQGGYQIPVGSTGINLAGLQRTIAGSAFLTANGQPLFDAEDQEYFSEYTPYRYLTGNGTPYADSGLATQSEMWPVYAYSFALDGSSIEQPKGTLNTSRIDRLELDIDVAPIPVGANYTYELQVFVETINFLEITSGMGGLKFAK